MLQSILEIYVVHHADDQAGKEVAHEVFNHFHGTTFSGLIGGAIEVFVRSDPWSPTTEVPRPLLFPGDSGPNGVSSACAIAVVPVLSLPLAQCVERGHPWGEYLLKIVERQNSDPEAVGVFPVAVDNSANFESRLGSLFSSYQRIAVPSGLAVPEPPNELRCRDLAQGIVQMLGGADTRLQVFVSHTRRSAAGENDVSLLIRLVRDIIAETRLKHFFDANDLQPGRDWASALQREASTSALLALRTDLYASRTWCQREMLIAKTSGMPIVIVDSLGRGEERGSYLMDHVPRIPVRETGDGWNKSDIRRALNLLVDECLKRAIWRLQEQVSSNRTDLEIAWWAPHAPEPITLARWLTEANTRSKGVLGDGELRVLHPDPPLGPDEKNMLCEMIRLMGHRGTLDVITPRGLAARGA